MAEVKVHVYDVTTSEAGNNATNFAIVQLNNAMKEAIPVGGVFHTAVQVYGDEEWGYGACENGTGVYSCPAGKNVMFTYRESIVVGRTSCSAAKVNQILKELGREWQGNEYDMLSKNCNNFSNEFLERLGVPKLPGWVNRFANAGGAAYEAALLLKETQSEMVHAGKEALREARHAAINAPRSLLNLSKGATRLRKDRINCDFLMPGRRSGSTSQKLNCIEYDTATDH